MSISFLRFRLSTQVQLISSAMFLGLSVQLLALQVSDVRAMRDVGLPAAVAVSGMQSRISILKEQSDVAQLQASVTGGASEEMLHMYVLPDQHALDRLLATVDVLTTNLQKEGALSQMSPVHVGDSVDATIAGSHFTKTPVSFETDVTEEGQKQLFLFQHLAGLLTVSDALSSEEQSTLLHLTEQENPAAVTALETFLATDLLTYSNNPHEVEQQLLKSFTSNAFEQSLRGIIQESTLQDVQQLLVSPFGHALQTQKLWPLRFMMPVQSAIADKGNGQFHVAMTWEAYSK